MEFYNILIASDHSGFLLKSAISDFLRNKNLSILDYGVDNQSIVDYPDFSKKVVDGLLEKLAPFGILICSTGIGMTIAANRTSEIRAALCLDLFMAERARAHNDANVLVLGSKILDNLTAFQIVEKFLSTNFEGGRHISRIAKIS